MLVLVLHSILARSSRDKRTLTVPVNLVLTLEAVSLALRLAGVSILVPINALRLRLLLPALAVNLRKDMPRLAFI